MKNFTIEKENQLKFLEETQRAIFNILEDVEEEKQILVNTQKAVLNILDDYSIEKTQAEDIQRAIINILDDYSIEKANIEKINIQLTSANKEVEQFAYVASHDLQEPLKTVTNYVRLFQKQYQGKLDSDADIFLDIIIGATSRMQALIKDLLDYSRIGNDIDKTPVDCQKLVREVLYDLSKSIQDSKAVLHFEHLPVINGSLTGLKSLFQNLISNALKFRKGGSNPDPLIRITAKDNNKEWLFKIKDNGIGIDKKYFHKLFVIFQRLHSKEEYHGTGIGLAQCGKIVELHGGKIWIESELGHGTTFYFTMPKT